MPPSPAFEAVIETEEIRPSAAELSAIGRLRVEAWTATHPDVRSVFPQGSWLDHHDGHAIHVVARSGGTIVGAARLCAHQAMEEIHPSLRVDRAELVGPFGYIARLAVRRDMRGRQIATDMDALRLACARRLSVRTMVVCCSSYSGETRLKALLDQGFVPFADAADTDPFPDERFSWLYKRL